MLVVSNSIVIGEVEKGFGRNGKRPTERVSECVCVRGWVWVKKMNYDCYYQSILVGKGETCDKIYAMERDFDYSGSDVSLHKIIIYRFSRASRI